MRPDAFRWVSISEALPCVRYLHRTDAYMESVPVLCAYRSGAFQVCILAYTEDDDSPRWLEDNRDRWDVTQRVVSWAFIPANN